MKLHQFSLEPLARRVLSFSLILSVVMSIVLVQPPLIVYADKAGVCGVPGYDGPATTLSGIVNSYYPGTANATAGETFIRVGAARAGGGPAIAAGDLLLVVQMQGADINGNNDERYGDGVGAAITGNTVVYSAANAYAGGSLTENFSAGIYEYAVATGPVAAGSVPISSGLTHDYFSAVFGTQGQRTFQVIRVPQFSSATLGGTVTALGWNGRTGGIVAFDVAGALNWNGNTVEVSSLGFRGGGGRQLEGDTGANTDYRTLSTTNINGSKGEGYSGTPRFVNNNDTLLDNGAANEGFLNGSYARGAAGNGGGGGTDGSPADNEENSGGGGGGNAGYGGMGGNTWRSALIRGGFGGAPFPGTAQRLVLGGGGGAGTTNNATGTPAAGFASSGAAGGGVVMIRSGTITGTGTINANGATANQSVLNDGGGGGGAGGSVVVIARNGAGSVGSLTVSAFGGNGGVTWPDEDGSIARHGPGGGGGGGFVFTSGALVTGNVNGGLNGTSTTANDAFGSTPGGIGTLVTNVTPANIPDSISGANCVPVTLTTTKTTSTPNILAGDTATYTITVSNAAGAGGAAGVNISDVLPAGFTYASTSSINLSGNAVRTETVNPTVGAGTPTWGTFLIPSDSSVTITFTVNVDSATPPDVYQNPATAAFLDPVRITTTTTLTSNYDPASSTGEDVTITASADLAVDKTDGITTVITGDTITYALTLTNNGPSLVSNTTISDPAATGLTKTAIGVCTATGGAICPTVGTGPGQMSIANLEAGTVVVPTLPNGDSISFTITANVTATSGSVANTFAAAPPSGTTDPNLTNNTSTDTDTLVTDSQIQIVKTPSVTAINGSSLVTYTYVVTNPGRTPLTSVTVTDDKCSPVTYVSGDVNTNNTLETTETWNYTCAATLSATTTNTATVTAAGSGNQQVRDTDSATVTLVTSALSKTVRRTSEEVTEGANVAIGEVVTYQVSVVIPPGAYSNAVLVDTMKQGLAFVGCDSIDSAGLATNAAGGFDSICNNPIVLPVLSTDPADIDRRVTFDFGTLTNSGETATVLTVTYRAAVLDIIANIIGADLNNSATWSSSGGPLDPAQTAIKIVEPDLKIEKTANINFISNGTTAIITLAISHTSASTIDAFDVVVSDVLPTGLDYVENTLDCNDGEQDPEVNLCAYDAATRTIKAQWNTFTRLPANDRGIVRFTVIGNASIPANGRVSNVANVEWSSIPGDRTTPLSFSNPPNPFATERFYDPGDPANFYNSNDTLILTPVGNGGGDDDDDGGNDGGGRGGGNSGFGAGGFMIPVTGFAPNTVTELSPASRTAYNSTNLTIEIPVIKVNTSIVGVQLKNGNWDVSWLLNRVGWLNGTAYPTWTGNSVLTAHVVNSAGDPGVFSNLGNLNKGEYIFVYNLGYRYTYKVVSNQYVQPDDITVLKHEDKAHLTLITCDTYNEKTGTYLRRVAVRAELVDVAEIK